MLNGTSASKICIHFGFYNYAKKLQNELAHIIQNHLNINPNLRLHFVGHSMGGSIAQISALLTSLQFDQVPITLTDFGCPKVFDRAGNTKFSERIKHNIVRLQDEQGADFVPKLPPAIMSCLQEGNGRMYLLPLPQKKRWWNVFQYHKMNRYWDALQMAYDMAQ